MGSQAHYGLLVDRRRQSYQAKELRITTMREVAMMDEAYLYDWFGVNAELLIDHAWGRESTAISDIKAYRTKSRSLSSGQVLMRDCHYEEGLIIAKEMMDPLCLDMAAKRIATDSVSLYVGYSHTKGVPGTSGIGQNVSCTKVRLTSPISSEITCLSCVSVVKSPTYLFRSA